MCSKISNILLYTWLLRLEKQDTMPTAEAMKELTKALDLANTEKDMYKQRLELSTAMIEDAKNLHETKLRSKTVECDKLQGMVKCSNENCDRFKASLESQKTANKNLSDEVGRLLDENKGQQAIIVQLENEQKSLYSTTENYKIGMKLIKAAKSEELPATYSEHLVKLRSLSDQDMSVVIRAALQSLSSAARNSILNASLKEDVANKDVAVLKATMESLLAHHVETPGNNLIIFTTRVQFYSQERRLILNLAQLTSQLQSRHGSLRQSCKGRQL